MMVDGHVVMKANNYDLEGGMPSVFDNGELNTDKSSAPLRAAPAPSRDGIVKKAETRGRKPTRVLSKAEEGRRTHNKSVVANRKGDELRRALFLDRHLPALRPFITEKVAASIKTLATSAGAKALEPITARVETQPDGISGVMREYQLEGVAWLTQMHDQGGVRVWCVARSVTQ